jgi:hypothetical protein
MALVFSSHPGYVKRLPQTAVAGAFNVVTIAKSENDLSSAFQSKTQKSLITSVGFGKSANAQFVHSIGGKIYVYAFGDKMGQAVIGGISFADCDDTAKDDQEHGVDKLVTWFEDNKISNSEDPMKIVIGRKTVLTGFLTEINVTAENARDRLFNFVAKISLIPLSVATTK